MKTDFYTKAVLTVIAICLVMDAAEKVPFISEAHAQGMTHVYIDGAASYSLQYAGPIATKPN